VDNKKNSKKLLFTSRLEGAVVHHFRGKGQESSQSRHKYLLAIIHHSTAQHSTAQLATIAAGFEPTASLQGTRTRNRCTTRAKQLSSFLR